MKRQTIIWRRLDIPGHEFASTYSEQRHYLTGTAILLYDRKFCRLDYQIECDLNWRTLSAAVFGLVGERQIEIEILVDAENRWKLNGDEVYEVVGCTDVDLNFSPVTNTLPIRRLNLAIGEKATVCAAWLRFPSFALEPLEQTYKRTGEKNYHYESAGGRFTTDIEINDFGFATNYANFWKIEDGK